MAIRNAVSVTILLCAVFGSIAWEAQRSRTHDRLCALRTISDCPATDDDGHMSEVP